MFGFKSSVYLFADFRSPGEAASPPEKTPFSLYHDISSVADPGSGAFLTPGSGYPGWIKIKIRIQVEHLGSYFRELGNKFFCLKYLNSVMQIGSRIQNLFDLEEKIRILDPG
jgi:hypothetical protein